MVEKDGTAPAHIAFSKSGKGTVCTQVQNSEPLKAYFESKVNDVASKMAIGSSTSVYTK